LAHVVAAAVNQSRWAHTSIGHDADIVLETLQSGLTVTLIATKHTDFQTCASDEELSIVVNRNRHDQFDFLPVIETLESPNRIVGLIEIASLKHGAGIEGLVQRRCSLRRKETFWMQMKAFLPSSALSIVRDVG
jgi:hypothetical protein